MTNHEVTAAIEPIPIEVERKWLIYQLRIPKDLEPTAELSLTQGYVAIASDGSETRVRQTTQRGGQTDCELTVKSKGSLVRGEQTIAITQEMFNELLGSTVGTLIQKTRLTIPYGEHLIELDIYEEELDGLIVAEVEFSGADQETATQAAADFVAPEWFGEEVTEDKRFKNQSLATNGFPFID